MQNLGSYKFRSFSRTLTVGLIITIVLVAGLSLAVHFILSSRKAKAELESRVEEYTSALTDALKVPLWIYSEETIEMICASYAQNEFVAKLLVEGQNGSVIFKKADVTVYPDGRYAAGESRAFKQGTSYSEFRPLVNVLDEMGEKIESQMRSLKLVQFIDRNEYIPMKSRQI